MLNKIIRYSSLILIVVIAVYLALWNRDLVNLTLLPGQQYQLSLEVTLLLTFSLGMLCALVMALPATLRSYFQKRQLQRREAHHRAFVELFVKARGFESSEEWARAASVWEHILKGDPGNVVALVQLSKCQENLGQLNDALRQLDQGRSLSLISNKNKEQGSELLFRAAELNLKLANKTAALDNLNLIIQSQPGCKALRMARDISIELDRLDDANEYHNMLHDLSTEMKSEDAGIQTLIAYKRICRDFSNLEQKPELKQKIKDLLKRNPSFKNGWEHLYTLAIEENDIDAAISYATQLAKITGLAKDWEVPIKILLSNTESEKALSLIKLALKETQNKERVLIELINMRVLLGLNMLEQAKRAIDDFEQRLPQNSGLIDALSSTQFLVIKALCSSRDGSQEEASKVWRRLAAGELSIEGYSSNSPQSANKPIPSPTLSTP